MSLRWWTGAVMIIGSAIFAAIVIVIVVWDANVFINSGLESTVSLFWTDYLGVSAESGRWWMVCFFLFNLGLFIGGFVVHVTGWTVLPSAQKRKIVEAARLARTGKSQGAAKLLEQVLGNETKK